MNLVVNVYHRLDAHRVTWTTLGLGKLNVTRSGPNAAKVEQALVDALKRALSDAPPAVFHSLQPVRGLELRTLALVLNLTGDGRRRTRSGRFPVVLEPRPVGEATLLVAYHPARQHEWFPLADLSQLEAQAASWFSRCWGELPDDEITGMAAGRRDALRAVALSAATKSLLDRLEARRRDVWDDLAPEPVKGGKPPKPDPVLREIGVDDTVAAAHARLPTGRPRTPWRKELQRLLGRDQPAPVAVVGPPGVGKTWLVHQWVHDQLLADDFPSHRNLDRVRHVWTVTGRRLIAGMSYLGDWEKRATGLLREARPDEVVLRVPDLHTWARVGRARDSDRNLAEMFQQPLAAGEVAMVAEATPGQWQRLAEEAPGFAALFTVVNLSPTSPGETLGLLFQAARGQEQERRVQFEPAAFRTILDLGSALFPGSALPGKATDLVPELARRFEPSAPSGTRAPAAIGAAEVLQLLSEKTGLPTALLAAREPLDPAELEQALAAQVMGQPAAVRAMADLVLRIRAGLTDPRRPCTVDLLSGPTGTGKTEMARCLAEYLYGGRQRLLRFDMGELGGPDAVARLIGDRWEPRGLLTSAVREQPFCVLLLDEIEKAHPSVFPLLLQLFDEGRLTDAAGEVADFTHAVVLMTSNLGASARGALGLLDVSAEEAHRVRRAIQDFFPPELWNRIDRVVVFDPLSAETARAIAQKELRALVSRWGLTERNVSVTCSERPLQRTVRDGFDPRYGARTVKRWLEENVGSLLVEALTEAAPAAQRAFHLYELEGRLRLHVEALREAEPVAGTLALEPLLRLGVDELRQRLPAAMDAVDALLAGEAARLFEEIPARLALHNQGDLAQGDALFHLEVLRQGLTGVRRRLGWLLAGHPADRLDVLEALAELAFFQRAVPRVQEPGQHAVVMTLARLGLGQERAPRFQAAGAGLLEALTQAVARSPRVRVESMAARLHDGATADLARPAPAQVEALLRRRPDLLALELVGLCALDSFAGESGCHVWKSQAHGTEVVRVDVAAGDGPARQALRRHLDGARRFRQALDEGGALPENPEGLRPTVRELRFDPPLSRNARERLEVEDYRLGWAETVQAGSLADVLPRLFMLHAARSGD